MGGSWQGKDLQTLRPLKKEKEGEEVEGRVGRGERKNEGEEREAIVLKCRKLLRHLLGVEPSVEPDFSGRTRNRPTGPFFFLFWTRFLFFLCGE